MAKPSKDIQERVVSIFHNEYLVSKANQQHDVSDFESFIDLFDAERTEKEYDWMSDIFLPEFPTHMLTQSAIDVSQYFQTRDFVDVYFEDDNPQGKLAAEATKELLNRTLNRKNLYHYQKYVRAKNINHLIGHVDLHCWWEQKTETDYITNTFGDIIDQRKAPVKDHFCYEVLDPRNVFTDSKYVYSMQDRDWIIIRHGTGKTLQQLNDEKDRYGYFNLNVLRDDVVSKSDDKTEAQMETTEADSGEKLLPVNQMGGKYDIFTRYGKFLVVDGTNGYLPGLDKDGKPRQGARYEEVIMGFAALHGKVTLIQFHRTPYIDANGNPYRPVIRGLCYIHPTRDAGVGDGKYSRELQVAINDTFNLGNDRTTLATLPTLKGKKYVTEDTDTIRIEPAHIMELNDPGDIEELKIEDNIQGALLQLGVLFNKMNQVTAIFPTTMGNVPAESSTTATAIAGAEGRTNQRTNYKSMTFEYTALTELYWMIQQMTWTFALPETGIKLMGNKVYNFNPTLDYTYKPVSASIETESSKAVKVKNWLTLAGYIANIKHPNAVNLINYIVSKVAMLMGDEYSDFSKALLNPNVPIEQQGGSASRESGQAQNQYALTQSSNEEMARASF